MSRCIQLLEQAGAQPPPMSGLGRAGQAYLLSAHQGRSPPGLRQSLQRFASEFVTTRFALQIEELARQEADDGRTAAWYMHRSALAALAWAREATSLAKPSSGPHSPRAWLEESHQTMLEFVAKNPDALSRMVGAEAFTGAAERVAALAGNRSGKRPDKAAVLTTGGCPHNIS